MKVLIVGFGSIGKRHYNILTSLLGKNNIFVVTRRETIIENSFISLTSVENMSDYDYFVIADQEEYENQKFLKEYFENNFLKSEKIIDIIIYDLRAAD